MSRAMKWAHDARRNRAKRVSRDELDFEADSLFWRGEDAALDQMVDGVPIGPRTIETAEEVETLLRGLEVPPVMPADGSDLPVLDMDEYAKARATDPETSHAAAKANQPGGEECIELIHKVVRDAGHPVTTDEIARAVLRLAPKRWAVQTVRTRVSQAGLRVVDKQGVSERGMACRRFVL